MSGNLIVGVYGKKASSFSLAVAYEDRKIVDLKPGTPVKMFRNGRPPSVTFKFLSSTQVSLQVELSKLYIGEVNLYMACVNSTQNLASNLPDSTNNNWKISPADFHSVMKIPQACVSCLYLINIEVKSSNGFTLLVEEESKSFDFVLLQDGLPYSGQLGAQESSPFLFRSSSETEEAGLRVDVEGSELEILISNDPMMSVAHYVWKETIPSDSKNHIVSLKESQDSQRNILYILFYNPANMSVSYNFTMTMKSAKTFSLQSRVQNVDIIPFEKIAFLYYSNIEDGETSLNITLSAYLVEPVESALRQGSTVKVLYWPEEETPGPGQEISLERSIPEVQDRDVSQALLMKSFVGKYLIEIANPWEFPVIFSIDLGPNQQLSGENLQYEDSFGLDSERTYKIFMTRTSVKWYYWLYSCYAPVDLKFEKGNKEVELLTIPQEGSYTYKETIEESGIKDRFRNVTVSANEKKGWHKIFMYSALVNEEKFWDYEVKNEELKMSLSYDYDGLYSPMTVEFDPVEFRDPEPTDKVSYSAEICSLEEDGQEAQVNICHGRTSYCQNSEVEVLVHHKEVIRMKFANVRNGRNFVKIKAFVKHKGQVIRFVPYVVSFVDIKSRFWFNFFVAVVGMIVIWVLWKKCRGKWCEKIKRMREDKRIELPAIGNIGKKKSYNQLEEIEEGQSPAIEEKR